MQQQVAEVGRVQFQQAALILVVKRGAAAVIGVRFARRDARGRQRAVLPAVDQPGQHPRGPALLVDVFRRDQLLEQADLVVGVEDREAGLQVQVARADQLGVAAQDLDADGMEGAEPRHPLDRLAQQAGDAVLHLARGLVGEGHGKDPARRRAALRQQVGDPRRQRASLAGARARKQQDGAVERLDRLSLRGVQPVEIGGGPSAARAHRPLRQGDAGGGGRRGLEGVKVVELAHGSQHRQRGLPWEGRVPVTFAGAGPVSAPACRRAS